jgi:hypothetical protein
MRERDVEQTLVRAARDAGGLALKFVSPGMLGVPDRIVVLPGGLLIFAELKAPHKRPRTTQKIVLRWLYHLGFRAVTVDNKITAKRLIERSRQHG